MPKGGFQELFEEAGKDRNRLIDILLDREVERTGTDEEGVVKELVAQWRRLRGNALQALAESLENRQIVQVAKATWRPDRQTTMEAQSVDLLMTIAALYWDGNTRSFLSPIGAEAVLASILVTLTEGTKVEANMLLEALLVAKGVSEILGRHILMETTSQDCRYACGMMAAPAAAALATLSGGSAEMIEHAIAFSMLRCVDFECLPVGEMVQLPCAARNAAQALGAPISVERALCGEVPCAGPDEALSRLYAVAH